jgi:hypothetical protein
MEMKSSCSNPVIPVRSRLLALLVACTATPAFAWDTSYLQGLLNATPAGGWVQANTTPFSSAWATQAQGGLPPGTYSNPGSIVAAWSGYAWDSSRGNLILWGGGHANYMGNEVYQWNAQTGAWSRGSLPSRLITGDGIANASPSEFFVVDGAAPQSAHTYENLIYAPLADRMLILGGAVFNTGGGQRVVENGTAVSAGIWQWDPAKANGNQVGGTTGSGYLPAIEGGNMWSRRPFGTNVPTNSPLEATTAYRTENGHDVIYQTRDSNASGFPSLYRLTLGNPALGESDSWERIAVGWNAANYQSSGTLDLENNLYVRVAFSPAQGNRYGLGVWNLNQASASAPVGDTFIQLELADGTPFQTNTNFAIAYDEVNRRFVMWDGSARGVVYYVDTEFNANGSIDTKWTVTMASSTTTAQPDGNFNSAAGSLGVLGKWQYIPELGAFMALDMYNSTTTDAGVWLYKPLAAAVPEPGAGLLLSIGGSVLLLWSRRRRRDV